MQYLSWAKIPELWFVYVEERKTIGLGRRNAEKSMCGKGKELSVTECRMTVVQLLSHVQLFLTPRTAAHQASLSFTISWSLLKFMSIKLGMSSNHLILYCPLPLLPSILPSNSVFSNCQLFASGGQSIGASASNKCSELISLRID